MSRTRANPTPEQQLDTPGPASPAASQGDNSWWGQMMNAIGIGGGYGTAGAMGREGAVQAQHQAAYNLGRDASVSPFSGDVYRNVPKDYAGTMFEAQWGAKSGGRYNAAGEQLVYTSPSFNESVGEAHAYDGMADRTMVKANYNTAQDPVTGRGGLADVTTLAEQRGMTRALTPEVGKKGPGFLWELAGEHPYTQTQQVGAGAADRGAGAIKVPSATGGNQIDIIPRNNPANAITPLEVTPFDAHGTQQATTPAGTSIKGMGVDNSVRAPGVVEFEPGSQIRAPTAKEPTPPGRGTSVRYGALGGGIAALGTDLYRMANGEDVGLGQVALDTGVGTAMGAGGALATDALIASGRGALGAGGIVGGVIEGGLSAYNNYGAYSSGQLSGNQAIANTVVDTGVGVGAGMAGAAAGAALGSIIPGAGTLVGAGLGFVGGMAGSYLAHALADKTGAAAWAKEKLGAGLGYVGDGISAVGSGLATAGGAVMDGIGTVGSGLASAGGAVVDGISSAGSAIAGGASKAWDAVTSW